MHTPKTNVIEIELTPEIEKWHEELKQGWKDRQCFPDKGLVNLSSAIDKAKQQPKIEPNVWNCQLQPINNNLLMNDKLNEIIGWINNHD